MSLRSYDEKLHSTARHLAQLRGGSAFAYYIDAALCSRVHGASPENYFVLRFFELPNAARSTFLTSGRSKAADNYLNRFSVGRDRAALADKANFNRVFGSLNHREYLYAPESSEKELAAFIGRRDEFMLKPCRGTQGRGIKKLRAADISDIHAFYSDCVSGRLLLEELIPQHPDIDAICPGCVNSLRINAARDASGSVRLIGAALRCGSPGAYTDNFHSGGIAYPVDMSSGVVSGFGRDSATLSDYAYSPRTLQFMPGLKIPHFELALEYVGQAMELVPSMGYIGWDIALTPGGVELIEGNYGYPGANIIQLDGVGKYPLILSCMGEAYEK